MKGQFNKLSLLSDIAKHGQFRRTPVHASLRFQYSIKCLSINVRILIIIANAIKPRIMAL